MVPPLAGFWVALPGGSIRSSGARHLVVSSQGGGEFSIDITREFTIGVDTTNCLKSITALIGQRTDKVDRQWSSDQK